MPSITKFIFALLSTAVLTAGLAVAATDPPTVENSLAADDRISRALLANDTTTLRHLLASDWIVVNANKRAVVSGMSMDKPYANVRECQTDVLVWKDGRWVSELLHESFSKSASSNC